MTEILEYEITELFEDLEKDRPCTPENSLGCSNPATWIAIQVCCGAEIPLCTYHRNMTIEWLNLMITSRGIVRCKFCGADELDPSTIIEWRSIK